MEQSKQQRIRELTDRLNRCRYEYYNLNAPSLTDAEYDALFDELSALEKETGFSMTNSPTQTVGCYPAVSALVKTAHPIPLLSLDGRTDKNCRRYHKRIIQNMCPFFPPCALYG